MHSFYAKKGNLNGNATIFITQTTYVQIQRIPFSYPSILYVHGRGLDVIIKKINLSFLLNTIYYCLTLPTKPPINVQMKIFIFNLSLIKKILLGNWLM